MVVTPGRRSDGILVNRIDAALSVVQQAGAVAVLDQLCEQLQVAAEVEDARGGRGLDDVLNRAGVRIGDDRRVQLGAQAALDVVNIGEQVEIEGRSRVGVEVTPQRPAFRVIVGQKLVVRREGETDPGGAVHEESPHAAALFRLEGRAAVFKANSA